MINPTAANHSALQKYENTVKPFLLKADAFVEYSFIVTEAKGHAYEVGYKTDFSQVDTVLVLGGDGTLHEFVNGLLSRSQVPSHLGVQSLPVGNGNGFIKSVCFTHGQSSSLDTALWMAIRGTESKATITRLVLDTHPVYSLVSVAYATAADIELN